MERYVVSPDFARFAKTHGSWRREDNLPVEDLLVGLADSVWKGSRIDQLETRVAERIAVVAKVRKWEAFSTLDEILTEITAGAEKRLSWQQLIR